MLREPAAACSLIPDHRDRSVDSKNRGLKATLPRLRILEIFETSNVRHLSAEDVYRLLLKEGTDSGLATVYRVLTQFEQAGLLIRHHFEPGKAVFELKQGGHHDHIVCMQCGHVEEFYDLEIEQRQVTSPKQHGFRIQDHSLHLYADCTRPDCRIEIGRTRQRRAGECLPSVLKKQSAGSDVSQMPKPLRKMQKANAAAQAAVLPAIPPELLDQVVKGPRSAEAVEEASRAFKKALIERALRATIREDKVVRNKAIYLGLGVRRDGTRDIAGLWIDNTEGAKFWTKVFNDLKTRGTHDILIAVIDGLKGMGEALAASIRPHAADLHRAPHPQQPRVRELEGPQTPGQSDRARLHRGQRRGR